MRILVTGGAGFIGSHLCKRLILEGHNVICMDNLSSGQYKNIKPLENNPFFHFIEFDITQLLGFFSVDRIYHLACPASPIFYQKDPIKTIETNIIGTSNLLKIADKANSRILLSSTSEVYGDPTEHPQTEEYWGNVNPIGPRSCYDEGKRVAETLMFDYHREVGTDIRVIRIFNTYGPCMSENDGRVVSNFITQALFNEDITIYGAGDQTRSFCFVDDLINGMILMMDQDNQIGPFNLGNTDERTILELAELIIELSGSSSKIVYEDLPENDPTRRKPDISKAQEFLKWSPQIDLVEGLSKTIAWWRSEIG